MLSNFHKFVPLYEQPIDNSFNIWLGDDLKIIHNEKNLCISIALYRKDESSIYYMINATIEFDLNSKNSFVFNKYIRNDQTLKFEVINIESEEVTSFCKMIQMFNIVSPSKLSFNSNVDTISIQIKSKDLLYTKILSLSKLIGKTSYLSLSMRTKDINFYYKYLFYLILIRQEKMQTKKRKFETPQDLITFGTDYHKDEFEKMYDRIGKMY